MALRVRCQCGNSFDLNDAYAGHLVRCPKCHSATRADRSAYTPASQADPLFDRDLFAFAPEPGRPGSAKLATDESDAPIAIIERPERLMRGLLVLAAGCAAMILVLAGVLRYAASLETGLGATAVIGIGGVTGLLIPRLFASLLLPKRHVVLHRAHGKRERVLEIAQDTVPQLVVATYTVRDATGEPIARLRTNQLLNVARRRWEIRTLADHVAFVAAEAVLFTAMRRRVMARFYRPERTTMLLYAGDDRRVLGEFKEAPTTCDRYMLDLRRDRHRKLDRRVALAIGVMLDLAEERQG
jgi:hypothetical protein